MWGIFDDGRPVNSIEGKLGQAESALHTVAGKMTQYDALIQSRVGGGGGKGGSGPEPIVAAGARGVIHDKDICMPLIPDKFESAKVFRRRWKDVKEYCEWHPKFPNCGLVFKTF